MWILIISLLALGVIASVAKAVSPKASEDEPTAQPSLDDSGCCGQHATCEKDSLLTALSRRIEYYNDEELDLFVGKFSDEYTPDEVNQFRDILYTMLDEDVAGWVRSLHLRGIELPEDIKEEVVLIVGERRLRKL